MSFDFVRFCSSSKIFQDPVPHWPVDPISGYDPILRLRLSFITLPITPQLLPWACLPSSFTRMVSAISYLVSCAHSWLLNTTASSSLVKMELISCSTPLFKPTSGFAFPKWSGPTAYLILPCTTPCPPLPTQLDWKESERLTLGPLLSYWCENKSLEEVGELPRVIKLVRGQSEIRPLTSGSIVFTTSSLPWLREFTGFQIWQFSLQTTERSWDFIWIFWVSVRWMVTL